MTDFRHYLALVLIVGYLFTLWVLSRSATSDDFKTEREVFEVVTAAFGPLIGSVVGFYFGSTARKEKFPDTPPPSGS
jgi:hypothetical protein